ncbi:MAG: hypothetical protein CMK07_04035 [Ponticaulis sp.]|nr:hypothetical protein [Ponticaulis sp.]
MARKALKPGKAVGQYIIRSEKAQDVLGVTYLGDEGPTAPGSAAVLIREVFPANLARRRGDKIHASRSTQRDEFDALIALESEKQKRYLALDTDGLIPALDHVEKNGTVYLVTEWPSGESLAQTLARDGLFSPGFARSLLSVLLPGLKALGEAGLVHSLISPTTIMRLDDGKPCVIAPDRLKFSGRDTRVMTLDASEKTPYLAPEFLNASVGEPGTASDVYSLCATFYNLLTGKTPASPTDRLKAAEAGEEDPLDLEVLRSGLSDDPQLSAALDKGLRLRVAERLATMSELESAMYLGPVDADFEDDDQAVGLSTTAAPSWWSRNGRGLMAGVGALLFVLLIFPLISYFVPGDGSVDDGAGEAPMVEVERTQEADEPTAVAAEVPVEEDEVSVQSGDAPEPADPAIVAEPETDAGIGQWLAVDQSDPAAILAFLNTDNLSASVRAQARARWRTLEAQAWQAAEADGTEPVLQAFVDEFATEPPQFARFAEAANLALSEVGTPVDTPASEPDAVEDASEDASEDAPEADNVDGSESADPAPEETTPEETPENPPLPPVEQEVVRACDDCPPMRAAAGGLMFSVHEVTVSEYQAFVQATGRRVSQGCFVQRANSETVWGYESGASFEAPGYPVTDAHPAVCVSFDDATAFAQWLSEISDEVYRLPTEDEWTALAGAPSPAALACGSGNFADASLSDLGVGIPGQTCRDGSAFAMPASSSDDAFSGLLGNVAEWVASCDGGDCSKRVILGGSWASTPAQIQRGLREIYPTNSRNNSLGFRVVLDTSSS